MALLLDQLTRDMTASLKGGNRVRVETLRYLLAAVRNEAISKYGSDAKTKLTDADVMSVIKKQVKTHKESIESYQKGNRPELVKTEEAQLAVLSEFIPSELSDEELMVILAPVAKSGGTNFGLVMKEAMLQVAGQADGGRVAVLLRRMMQKQ